jgi:hypothetical protein
MYQNINHPEIIRGMKYWVNEKNKLPILMLHYTADPAKDPERDGAEWIEQEHIGQSKAKWNQEMEIDFTQKSGKLIYGTDFCDYNPQMGYRNPHWIEPFEWEEPVEMILALDYGQRHPTCALVGIWTKQEELFIVDEYYKPNLPSHSSRGMFSKFAYLLGEDYKSILHLTTKQRRDRANERFAIKVIDPSTLAKNRSKIIEGEEVPYSVHEDFYDSGWDFEKADNDVDAGITRVREYMNINPLTGRPRVMFFKGKCDNLQRELENYHYKVYTEEQLKTRSESEEPVKKDDDAVDALKYLIMTRPAKPQGVPKPKTRLQKDFERLARGPVAFTGNWNQD